MRLHNEDNVENLVDMNVSILTFANDGSGVFNFREDTEKSSVVIYDIIAK